MAKRHEPYEPDYWTDIIDQSGEKIGSWTIRRQRLIVYDTEGNSKTAAPSHGGANASLALIILSEFARPRKPTQ